MEQSVEVRFLSWAHMENNGSKPDRNAPARISIGIEGRSHVEQIETGEPGSRPSLKKKSRDRFHTFAQRFKQTQISKFLPVFVFLFFFGFSFILGSSTDSFLSPGDSLFHVRMSHGIFHPEEVLEMPVYTTQYTNRSNLYFGYHLLMSPFVTFCAAENYACIISGAKLFHQIIFGIVLTILFLVFRKIAKRNGLLWANHLAIVLTLLTLSSPQFLFRAIIERPLVISMLIFILYIYFLLKRRLLIIFILSLLLPLFYSISFILFLPAGIFLLISLFGTREDRVFGLQEFLATLGGIAISIIMRPDSYNYFLNSYVVHLTSLYQNILQSDQIATIQEFQSGLSNVLEGHAWWVPIFLIICSFFLYKTLRLRGKSPEKQNLLFLNIFSLFLITLFLIIARTLEYAVPVLFVTLAFNLSFFYFKDNILRKVMDGVLSKKLFVFIMSCLLVVTVCQGFRFSKYVDFIERYSSVYLSIIDEIKSDYKPGELILSVNPAEFTSLFFYGPEMLFTTGMDSAFTRAYDPKIFWLLEHLNSSAQNCNTPICTEEDELDTYDVLKNELKIKYIIIREKPEPEIAHFFEKIKNDPRIKLKYYDSRPPAVSLYLVD